MYPLIGVLEWKKKIDLFTLPMIAKQANSLNELTRITGDDCDEMLMGGLNEAMASWKLVSTLRISQRQASRLNLGDQFSRNNFAPFEHTEL